MQSRFYHLLWIFFFLELPAFSQAPDPPRNPVPAHQGSAGSSRPDLCATVSDPGGDNLQVRYYGRQKTASSSQKFTIVFLPDTQYYTEEPQENHGGNIAMFNAQTAWIAANRESKNIVYVGQLGDCVENADHLPGPDKEIEWRRARDAMATIENPTLTNLPQGLPFGICVGNHEQSPFGSAAGTTNLYNKFFGVAHFAGREYYGGHYGTNNDNHYQVFSTSGIDFMVISLEYDLSTAFTAPGGPLDWAEGLVQNNPGKRIIIMTHYIMDETATFGPQGEKIYERLKVYPNFSFLMGAHVSSLNGGEAHRTDVYNGNVVHSILTDYQFRENGGDGFLRIYEFDPNVNKVYASTYSPYRNIFEMDASSQFELPFTMQPELTQVNNVASGSNSCYTWEGLSYTTSYEWSMQVANDGDVSFGPVWTFATPGDPLPVSLLDFYAGIENKKIKITWSTTTEMDNNLFEIERSTDGRLFHKIGEVAGHGNSNNMHHYAFYDEQPFGGKIFYRLRQVDINGQYSYSNTRIVVFGSEEKFSVYPNPLASAGKLTVFMAQAGRRKVNVTIHDINGRILHTSIHQLQQNSFLLEPYLSPGVYFLKIQGEQFSSTKKIIVTR